MKIKAGLLQNTWEMIRFTEAFLNFDTQFVDEIIPANYLITWLTGFWGRAHNFHAAASKNDVDIDATSFMKKKVKISVKLI